MFFVDKPIECQELIDYLIHDNSNEGTLVVLTEKGQNKIEQCQDKLDIDEFIYDVTNEFNKFE